MTSAEPRATRQWPQASPNPRFLRASETRACTPPANGPDSQSSIPAKTTNERGTRSARETWIGSPFSLAPPPREGVVPFAERGQVHDPHDRFVIHGQRDQVRPDLHAVHEVLRPVDRIDDPPPLALPFQATLFPEDAVPREAILHRRPDRRLDRQVGFGDRRTIRF
jgi:hypothetical protein